VNAAYRANVGVLLNESISSVCRLRQSLPNELQPNSNNDNNINISYCSIIIIIIIIIIVINNNNNNSNRLERRCFRNNITYENSKIK